MKRYTRLFLATCVILLSLSCKGQTNTEKDTAVYTYLNGDRSGIGKWYMGREIAHVMGFQGMSWLERSEREEEEETSQLIANMNIQPDDVIADIGAGSGYHVFKMAPIASAGTVYAVDIQQEMLDAIQMKNKKASFSNIVLIKGNEQNVNLPNNTVDKILMVDVYHEFSDPVAMIASMKASLKEDGAIYLIEYRGEDPDIPIKRLHKMTEKQAVKEFTAGGFTLKENISNLPWQHCMVFIKK